MKNLQIIIIILLSLSLTSSLQAQDFESDIKKMYQTYLSASSIFLQVETNIYNNHSASPVETTLSTVKRQGKNYYCEFDGIEFLVNEDYKVMVNHDVKAIVYGDLSEDERLGQISFEQKKADDIEGIELVLSDRQEVRFIEINNGIKHYQIKKDNQLGIRNVHIYLDTKSYFLHKMEYTYTQGMEEEAISSRVTIDYTKVDFTPKFKPSDFSEQSFIKQNEEGQFVAGLSSYELINASNTNF